ncbi:MAG: hypothetical protein ACLFVJ_22430 [Persicimonas sp.]
MRRQFDSFVIVILLAAFWLPGCSSDGDTDSETHWQSDALQACRSDSDCVGDRSCFCGVCTSSCDVQDECAQVDPAATCTAPDESVCSQQFASQRGACFESCQTDAECAQRDPKLQCVGGFCVGPQRSTPPDAGDAGDTDDAPESGLVEPRLCGDGVDCCAPEVEALLNIPYTGDEGVGPNAIPDSVPFRVYNGAQLDRNAVTEGTWVGMRTLDQSETIECPGNATELSLPCEVDQVGVFETTDGTTVEFVIGLPASVLDGLPTQVAAEIDTTDGLAIRHADDDTLILGNGGPHTTAINMEYRRTFSGFELTLPPADDMSTARCLAEPDFCNRLLRIDTLELHADADHEVAPGESLAFTAGGVNYRLWHVVSMQRNADPGWGTGEAECSDGTPPRASFVVARDGQ